MQINKLLYICFGFYGARHGAHLFGDEIQAWPYGSVVPSVYRAHKRGELQQGTAAALSANEEKTMARVLDIYGRKAPSLLVELTHQKGTPWSNAYVPGKKGAEIKKGDIIRYYADFLSDVDDWVEAMSTEGFSTAMHNLAMT